MNSGIYVLSVGGGVILKEGAEEGLTKYQLCRRMRLNRVPATSGIPPQPS
jgi:hypothetical protein